MRRSFFAMVMVFSFSLVTEVGVDVAKAGRGPVTKSKRVNQKGPPKQTKPQKRKSLTATSVRAAGKSFRRLHNQSITVPKKAANTLAGRTSKIGSTNQSKPQRVAVTAQRATATGRSFRELTKRSIGVSKKASNTLTRRTSRVGRALRSKTSIRGLPKRQTFVASMKSGLNPTRNAYSHFKDHRKEFPEYKNASHYLRGVRQFVEKPPSGTLFKTRKNGDKLLYHPRSNTFAVVNKNGLARTMFRPKDRKSYWKDQ